MKRTVEQIPSHPVVSAVAVELLQEEVRAFLRFDATIEQRLRNESHVPYKGVIHWPEHLRHWRRKRQRELIAFARKYGLCRKDIKDAVLSIKSELDAQRGRKSL